MVALKCTAVKAARAQEEASVAAARAASVANARTSEGKEYQARFELEVVQHHFQALAGCKAAAEADRREFSLLLRIGADGSVQEILLAPETQFAVCVRSALSHVTFPRPPAPDYWVDVDFARER